MEGQVMAVPARKIESEGVMEERTARLEVKVDHLQADVTELKVRTTRLEEKVDNAREATEKRIDGVRDALEKKIDALRDSIESLKVGRWVDRVWWLVIAGGMLGVMARGFKWI